MKLKDLHEARYARSGILQRYENAYHPIENEPTQITPDVLFQSYDIEYPNPGGGRNRLAGVFTFQLSAKTIGEICRQVKCPSCASQEGEPCYKMRGKIHKDRFKEVNRYLHEENILINQDVQHARGFVKYLLKKYNLPYTEIRINVIFAKWVSFAAYHPELKETSESGFS